MPYARDDVVEQMANEGFALDSFMFDLSEGDDALWRQLQVAIQSPEPGPAVTLWGELRARYVQRITERHSHEIDARLAEENAAEDVGECGRVAPLEMGL